MCRMRGIILWAVPFLIVAGCGKPPATDQSTTANPANAPAASSDPRVAAQTSGPAAAVAEFLEAVRTGNDEKATKMLSTVARQKTAALNRNVTPPASDTARFSVGKVSYVGENGARVKCTWTDFDPDGHPKTDDAVWVLRREPQGWRVAGVAALVFPDQPPVVLNFEDPEDMLRQQQWVRDEIRRRMEKEDSNRQAKGRENWKKTYSALE